MKTLSFFVFVFVLGEKEVDVALLEAVQRANKVFHVWICFSRAKHPAPAGRLPALPCLCRRFHLGANTILWLSFHCTLPPKTDEEREKWKS